jgi:hypothetical protein
MEKKNKYKKGDNIQYVLNKGHATDELQPAIGLILRRKKRKSSYEYDISGPRGKLTIYHEEKCT